MPFETFCAFVILWAFATFILLPGLMILEQELRGLDYYLDFREALLTVVGLQFLAIVLYLVLYRLAWAIVEVALYFS